MLANNDNIVFIDPQTASVLSPYIYEEDNWVDDMELGAMELYKATGDTNTWPKPLNTDVANR